MSIFHIPFNLMNCNNKKHCIFQRVPRAWDHRTGLARAPHDDKVRRLGSDSPPVIFLF